MSDNEVNPVYTLVSRWHSRNNRQWIELHSDGWSAWFESNSGSGLMINDGLPYMIERMEALYVPSRIRGKAYRVDSVEIEGV